MDLTWAASFRAADNPPDTASHRAPPVAPGGSGARRRGQPSSARSPAPTLPRGSSPSRAGAQRPARAGRRGVPAMPQVKSVAARCGTSPSVAGRRRRVGGSTEPTYESPAWIPRIITIPTAIRIGPRVSGRRGPIRVGGARGDRTSISAVIGSEAAPAGSACSRALPEGARRERRRPRRARRRRQT
jgi:hypothetical protein